MFQMVSFIIFSLLKRVPSGIWTSEVSGDFLLEFGSDALAHSATTAGDMTPKFYQGLDLS